MKDKALAVQSIIENKNRILLITHYNPDGDAIGSTMAMYNYLIIKGFEVNVMVPNDFPDFLKWIPGASNIIIYLNNPHAAIEYFKKADAIICLDFNEPTRLKEMGVHLSNSKVPRILIDHHPNPSEVFDVQISQTSASATAQLVYQFIESMGDTNIINKTIAECIYTGIMTDTGNFNHNCNNPVLFEIVANLLRKGIDKDIIFENIFNNFSANRMKLMGYCLNEKMVVIPDCHTAYIWLTQAEQDKYKFKPGDSEGFVNLPLSIKGIKICALFVEKKDVIRVSLRSRGTFAVNKISEEYFEGGGHRNASGGESKLGITETIKKFELVIKLMKNDILEAVNN